MSLPAYQLSSKIERKDAELVFKNGLVELGEGNLIYARENNRIQQYSQHN
jgi:hypothetical protein